MIKKILAAIDGSEHAWKALDLAADTAQQHAAQLIVLHVVRFEPLPDGCGHLLRPNPSRSRKRKAAIAMPGPAVIN